MCVRDMLTPLIREPDTPSIVVCESVHISLTGRCTLSFGTAQYVADIQGYVRQLRRHYLLTGRETLCGPVSDGHRGQVVESVNEPID